MNRRDHPPKRDGWRSLRLEGYDYSQPGAYFVTFCTHARRRLFGEVIDGAMHLNRPGQIVAEEWQRSAQIRTEIELDMWVVMPDHMHALVLIADDQHHWAERPVAPMPAAAQQHPNGPPPRSLGALMAGFKSAATVRINQLCRTPRAPVWQRNYWDRIIRDEAALNRVREYIRNNPARWEERRRDRSNNHEGHKEHEGLG